MVAARPRSGLHGVTTGTRSGAPQDRPDLLICGGSHLAAVGVPPTGTFPVLVARRLRPWRLFADLRTVFYSGDPAELVRRQDVSSPRGSVVVLLPRNMYGIPLPHHLTMALARLRGRRLTLEDLGRRAPQPVVGDDGEGPAPSAPGAERRAGPALRWLVALGLSIACLPSLPFVVSRYGRRLDAVLASGSSLGWRRVVLTTPIPLPWRRYPGASWYQAALAQVLRRRAGDVVTVADAYRRLKRLPPHLRTLPGDPLHLTAEGHRTLADEITAALGIPAGIPPGVPHEKPSEKPG